MKKMNRKNPEEIGDVIDNIIYFLKNNNKKTCIEICDYVSTVMIVNKSNVSYYLKNLVFSEDISREIIKKIDSNLNKNISIYEKKMYKKIIIKEQNFYTIVYSIKDFE